MKNILIRYNPFSQKTALLIDGAAQAAGGGRFQEYVLKNTLDLWLVPGVRSYQRWDGFLPELMEMLNEDKLEIRFEGTRDDGIRFRNELLRQHRMVEDRGFDPELYALTVGAWELQNIRKGLLAFSDRLEENLVTGTAHKRLQLFKKLLAEEPNVENLKLCRTMALEIIQDCCDYCARQETPSADMRIKQVFWSKAGKNIHQIFQAL